LPTSEVLLSLGDSIVALFSGGSALVAGLRAYVSKIIADRSIETQEAALNQLLERYKAGLSEALKRVRSDLFRKIKIYKSKLRKAEILFNR
jgi:hypothetical protein